MSGLPSILPSFRFWNRNDEGGDKRVGSGLTDSSGSYVEPTTDPVLSVGGIPDTGLWPTHLKNHVTEGLLRMILRGPRNQSILSSLLIQTTEIEYSLFQLLLQRDINYAEGAQLDGLGSIVGEARNDRDDDAYRLAIRVRRLVNNSDGKLGQLYEIVNLLMTTFTPEDWDNPPRIYEHYPASIGLHIDQGIDLDGFTGDQFAALVREAKPAGVGMSITYQYTNTPFMFSTTDSPETSVETGWGSTEDAGAGGDFASAR